MVLLVTSDNEQFNADKDVVERSVLIKNMLEGACTHTLSNKGATRSDLAPDPFFCRCRRIRPTHPSPQCVLERDEEGTPPSCLSLITVDSPLLFTYQVLEYCEHHRGEPLPSADAEQSQDETRKRTTDISEWDQKFITVDQEMLFEIILAANYLDIKSLLYDSLAFA